MGLAGRFGQPIFRTASEHKFYGLLQADLMTLGNKDRCDSVFGTEHYPDLLLAVHKRRATPTCFSKLLIGAD